MALTINTNVASLGAQRNLARNQAGLGKSLSRLSSGLRVNTAADDAAGLAISEKLKSQVRSLAQAERNANDAISMMQTGEGALNEISGILVRMRELAVQSATDTVGSTERSFIHDEFGELRSEIGRILEVTEFNDNNVIGGASALAAAMADQNSGFTFQVGIDASENDRIHVRFRDVGIGTLSTLDGNMNDISLGTMSGALQGIDGIDRAIERTSTVRAKNGATVNRLQIVINNLATARENLSAANSRIRDVDVAEETASLTRGQILMQAGVSVLAQANQTPGLALSLLG